jgi:hypothetical protein
MNESDARQDGVLPDADASPEVRADELFSHGVLHVFHETDGAVREGRVGRVMASIASPAEVATNAGRVVEPRRHRRLARFLGRGSLLAAIIVGVVFLASPATTTSYASVEEAITAMRGPGDRRYEVRAQVGPAETVEKDPHATIDSRSRERMVLRLKRPDGGMVIVGRDVQGEWAITPEGGVERGEPRRAWPGWAIESGESLFADSIDRWLEAAADTYTFSKAEVRSIPGREGVSAHYVVGVRKQAGDPRGHRLRGADRVELWIDPASKIVERMELSWKPPMDRMGGGPGEEFPRRGPERGRDGPPRPRPGPDGQMPEGAGKDGVPAPQDAVKEGTNPREEGPGMERDGGHRPRGPRPPMDGERPGAHRRPPPDGEGPRDRGGPHSGSHGGPPGGPHGGPQGGPEGGPRGGGPQDRPERRPPLRRLVIDRIEAPAFEDAWFSPEKHLSEMKQKLDAGDAGTR